MGKSMDYFFARKHAKRVAVLFLRIVDVGLLVLGILNIIFSFNVVDHCGLLYTFSDVQIYLGISIIVLAVVGFFSQPGSNRILDIFHSIFIGCMLSLTFMFLYTNRIVLDGPNSLPGAIPAIQEDYTIQKAEFKVYLQDKYPEMKDAPSSDALIYHAKYRNSLRATCIVSAFFTTLALVLSAFVLSPDFWKESMVICSAAIIAICVFTLTICAHVINYVPYLRNTYGYVIGAWAICALLIIVCIVAIVLSFCCPTKCIQIFFAGIICLLVIVFWFLHGLGYNRQLKGVQYIADSMKDYCGEERNKDVPVVVVLSVPVTCEILNSPLTPIPWLEMGKAMQGVYLNEHSIFYDVATAAAIVFFACGGISVFTMVVATD